MNSVALDILKFIVKSSKEGDFVIVDYDDFRKETVTANTLTNSDIIEAIRYLKLNNYIVVKFQQDETIVTKPTADGYSVFREVSTENVKSVDIKSGTVERRKGSMLSCILAGAAGGLLSGGLIVIIWLIVHWQLGL